jgi:HEAT repeat protein
MRCLVSALGVSLVVLATTISAAALLHDQAASGPEAAQLAEGWALLAKGDAGGAAGVASQELLRNPNSVAALALAVDAELVRGGAAGALTSYEKWLGSRRVDAAYVLRRIARTTLVEASGKQLNVLARLEALKALAADGDAAAAASLELASASNSFGETRALASLGNEQAVKRLLVQLDAMPGGKTPIIDALGESGSKLAVPALKALLTDQNDLNRAAAADALGRLGATDAIPQIKLLLGEKLVTVRLKAAGALLRLNDSSGQPLLTELSSSEHAAIRVAAAREMASQPDAAWQGLVRTLTGDADPTVRLEAARLIAPYDQPLAKSVLDAVMRDDNIGIREVASSVMVERVASDFATLRTLLHSGDVAVRVKAAARILELTR